MLYIRINQDDENKLIYYCRKCGNEDTIITEDNNCIMKTVIKKRKDKIHYDVNEFIKKDPTIPIVENIPCPNDNCISKTNKQNEVLYIRYDDDNMKYVYICKHCDKIWTLDKLK
uniref:Aspartate carbamoyltransferase regulatory subunit C-terminal domain-containing protein n=1 Tax=uncultured marine group II/III euryarchaeote AD1000_88_G11 TaxID=1457822 RepID=A0A075G570_9EURY|nr:hypothetical protein [uncultured marine group II/III euryarchaeote AD1000_88_G11]